MEQAVHFRLTSDGLVVDPDGELVGVVVDQGAETVTLSVPGQGAVVLPRVAVDGLRDVAEEPADDAGVSAGGGAAR